MSFSYYDYSANQKAYFIIALITSVISSVFSFILLILIWQLKTWNGNITLIWYMSLFQLMYDVSFCPGVVDFGDFWLNFFANVAQIFGGLFPSLITNVIALIVLYVVQTRKSFDVMKNMKWIMLGTLLPSIVTTIVYIYGNFQNAAVTSIATLGMYYWMRLISIFLNFAAYFYTQYLVYRMNANKSNNASIQTKAIYELVSRMKYYPLIQALARSGCAYYEEVYGWNFDPPNAPAPQFAAQCLLLITAPAAGVGYFIIFLVMQPNAMSLFLTWFDVFPSWMCLGYCGSKEDEFTDSEYRTSSQVRNSNLNQNKPTNNNINQTGGNIGGTLNTGQTHNTNGTNTTKTDGTGKSSSPSLHHRPSDDPTLQGKMGFPDSEDPQNQQDDSCDARTILQTVNDDDLFSLIEADPTVADFMTSASRVSDLGLYNNYDSNPKYGSKHRRKFLASQSQTSRYSGTFRSSFTSPSPSSPHGSKQRESAIELGAFHEGDENDEEDEEDENEEEGGTGGGGGAGEVSERSFNTRSSRSSHSKSTVASASTSSSSSFMSRIFSVGGRNNNNNKNNNQKKQHQQNKQQNKQHQHQPTLQVVSETINELSSQASQDEG